MSHRSICRLASDFTDSPRSLSRFTVWEGGGLGEKSGEAPGPAGPGPWVMSTRRDASARGNARHITDQVLPPLPHRSRPPSPTASSASGPMGTKKLSKNHDKYIFIQGYTSAHICKQNKGEGTNRTEGGRGRWARQDRIRQVRAVWLSRVGGGGRMR